MQALLELDCIPAGMELFPAANDDQWTLIRGVIDDCDYYIVIVGGRYGSIASSGLSYTQMEYEYAITQGKPVIGFLHKDPGNIPANKCEKTPEARAKLEAFRERVKQKMCRYWASPAELGSVVSRSLVKLIKTNPAVGWVKSDLLPDQTAAEEILRLRKRIEELQEQVEHLSRGAISETQHLAQGHDKIQLNYTYRTVLVGQFRAEENHKEFMCTWNELFAAVSPLLIDEVGDRVLKQAFDRFMYDRAFSALKIDAKFKKVEPRDVSLDEEDFNTIKVQFLALQLMAKSAKKKPRSVSDRNAYWMLTPYGESVMMSLRAIQRKEQLSSEKPKSKRSGRKKGNGVL